MPSTRLGLGQGSGRTTCNLHEGEKETRAFLLVDHPLSRSKSSHPVSVQLTPCLTTSHHSHPTPQVQYPSCSCHGTHKSDSTQPNSFSLDFHSSFGITGPWSIQPKCHARQVVLLLLLHPRTVLSIAYGDERRIPSSHVSGYIPIPKLAWLLVLLGLLYLLGSRVGWESLLTHEARMDGWMDGDICAW